MRKGRLAGTVLCLVAAAPVAAHDAIRAEFTTADGVQLVGDYWTPIDMTRPAPVVILLHMYRSDRSAWMPLIPALEQAGFAMLALDLRGHGESIEPAAMSLQQRVADRDATVFNAMHQDVAAAMKWLEARKEVDLRRVAIIGASVGCSVALHSATRDPRIDTIVLMTPGKGYLGVDSLTHIKKYGKRPILILTSEEELDGGALPLAEALSPPVAASCRERASDASRSAWVFSNADGQAEVRLVVLRKPSIHGTRMFGEVEVEDQIAAFAWKNVR